MWLYTIIAIQIESMRRARAALPARLLAIFATIAFMSLLILSGVVGEQPSHALPVYARQYGVECATCHSAVPALNSFGMAFQANHFNWPGGAPPNRPKGLDAIPLSGLVTATRVDDISFNNLTDTNFRTLELFATSGFRMGSGVGGFFVDDIAAVRDAQAGSLNNVFVAAPLGGSRGQLAVELGQFTPLTYQYDPINSLTRSLPAALDSGIDGFAFAGETPGVELDYFNNRGSSSPDGNYVTFGSPIQGQLTLNSESRLYGFHGAFLHAFTRRGDASFGVFGYDSAGNYLDGALATQQIGNKLDFLEAGSVGHDQFSNIQNFSAEADYIPAWDVAVTGRLEGVSGGGEPSGFYPVAGVSLYPFRTPVIRLAAETTQQKANRSVTVALYGAF
jgi:hypothetical protein